MTKDDWRLLIAISTLAWVLVKVSHEMIGHAGAAVLLRIPVGAVCTTTASIEWDQEAPIGAYRAIYAAGTLVNLIGGVAVLIMESLHRQANSVTRYFLWLLAQFSSVNVAMNVVWVILMNAPPVPRSKNLPCNSGGRPTTSPPDTPLACR